MLIIGLIVVGTALLVAVWQHIRLARFRSGLSTASNVALLEQDLASLMNRAREELTAGQIAALTAELHRIKGIEHQMGDQGSNLWEARHVSLEGAVQSVLNHLALNERLSG
jgi:hypothetical protein